MRTWNWEIQTSSEKGILEGALRELSFATLMTQSELEGDMETAFPSRGNSTAKT